jgi:hypothetical protein
MVCLPATPQMHFPQAPWPARFAAGRESQGIASPTTTVRAVPVQTRGRGRLVRGKDVARLWGCVYGTSSKQTIFFNWK